MEKIKNFKEILDGMISPLDNPDFYALLLTKTSWTENGRFTFDHEYILGSSTYKTYHKLLGTALKTYIYSQDEAEFNAKYPNQDYTTLRNYFEEIASEGEEEKKVTSFLSSNAKFLESYLSTLNSQPTATGFFYFKSHYLQRR